MAPTPTKIARSLTLFGEQLIDDDMDLTTFLEKLKVDRGLYRQWLLKLSGGSGHVDETQFLCEKDGKPRFGPGAGTVLGISLGTTSLRSALVDANGLILHEHTSAPKHDQLALPPAKLLDRVASSATEAMRSALADEGLLIDGKLRLRGVAIAWPSPVDREKRPAGHALVSNAWRASSLIARAAERLKIEEEHSHAINDCWAASIAVAFDHTRKAGHADQAHPELTIVLRIAGGISAATIVIEPPESNGMDNIGRASGFADSVLLGGADAHAGELGHVTVPSSTIDERNMGLPSGLARLTPFRCSCVRGDDPVPHHLEAYVSQSALAQRIAPGHPPEEESNIIAKVMEDPESKVHKRALEDVGIVVADTLLSSVSVLNPAQIVMTGSLSHPIVRDAFDTRLEDEHRFIRHPRVMALEGKENKFIRARGAALAVLRKEVYRELGTLVGGFEKTIADQIRKKPEDIDKIPWA
jgi:predicted NBD/HSP70 family sugar kinase